MSEARWTSQKGREVLYAEICLNIFLALFLCVTGRSTELPLCTPSTICDISQTDDEGFSYHFQLFTITLLILFRRETLSRRDTREYYLVFSMCRQIKHFPFSSSAWDGRKGFSCPFSFHSYPTDRRDGKQLK